MSSFQAADILQTSNLLKPLDVDETPGNRGSLLDSSKSGKTSRLFEKSKTAKSVDLLDVPNTKAKRFELMGTTDFFIPATDGHPLAATLFEGSNENGPVVVVNSGVAIPRKVYSRFAKHLADVGAAAVITYDYRGIDKPLRRKQSTETSIFDWPEKDFTAIIEFAERSYPSQKLVGVGHSFGANLLGFTKSHSKFERFLAIASGSGYIGYTNQELGLGFWLNLVGPKAAALTGSFPKWLGFGSGMPLGAFRDWLQWFNNPRYFMSDERFEEKTCFKEVIIPIRFLNFSDDPWVTRRSVAPVSSWFTKAKLEFSRIEADEKTNPIGHFGFFKKRSEGLWFEQSKWLLDDKQH